LDVKKNAAVENPVLQEKAYKEEIYKQRLIDILTEIP